MKKYYIIISSVIAFIVAGFILLALIPKSNPHMPNEIQKLTASNMNALDLIFIIIAVLIFIILPVTLLLRFIIKSIQKIRNKKSRNDTPDYEFKYNPFLSDLGKTISSYEKNPKEDDDKNK